MTTLTVAEVENFLLADDLKLISLQTTFGVVMLRSFVKSLLIQSLLKSSNRKITLFAWILYLKSFQEK